MGIGDVCDCGLGGALPICCTQYKWPKVSLSEPGATGALDESNLGNGSYSAKRLKRLAPPFEVRASAEARGKGKSSDVTVTWSTGHLTLNALLRTHTSGFGACHVPCIESLNSAGDHRKWNVTVGRPDRLHPDEHHWPMVEKSSQTPKLLGACAQLNNRTNCGGLRIFRSLGLPPADAEPLRPCCFRPPMSQTPKSAPARIQPHLPTHGDHPIRRRRFRLSPSSTVVLKENRLFAHVLDIAANSHRFYLTYLRYLSAADLYDTLRAAVRMVKEGAPDVT
ncbi:uncharacterized protein CLUP02_09221 [Colletotrichum lupini]|uniref:Uncharacterized protein n=1 Tax=Colletotrichum lupini TaxID=145971 RepID=A0A9Q8SV95_9PEZI|nr:uncharacterized protein CLUP02_09221 [Colletotrichum lupini]UQC83725.1 hypothetical protein CLUP02_09221 [Colletotrichum lupini]